MDLIDVVVAVAALGSGIVAGVFFGFSTFVMNGLGRLPTPAGLAAMQSINVAAVRPAFMTALFGPAALCLVLVVAGVSAWDAPGSKQLVAGGGAYLLGTVGVTIARNVPLNNALVPLEPVGRDAEGPWRDYVRVWTRWNHVRTISSVVAAGAFVWALLAST